MSLYSSQPKIPNLQRANTANTVQQLPRCMGCPHLISEDWGFIPPPPSIQLLASVCHGRRQIHSSSIKVPLTHEGDSDGLSGLLAVT